MRRYLNSPFWLWEGSIVWVNLVWDLVDSSVDCWREDGGINWCRCHDHQGRPNQAEKKSQNKV
jgi:hypothetical protein